MDIWLKRGLLALGALVAIYLVIRYVLPILFQALGMLAHIVGWIVLIVVILFAVWFLVQKTR